MWMLTVVVGLKKPVARTAWSPDSQMFLVTADPSGVVRWDAASGSSGGSGWDLLLLPVLWAGNLLVHRLVFRSGWVVRLRSDTETLAMRRCHSYAAASEHGLRLAQLIEAYGIQAAITAMEDNQAETQPSPDVPEHP